MKRINVMVSDEAKLVLIKYQKASGISSQDAAADFLLLCFDKCQKIDP
jgi:hypothetical protein